MSFYTKMQEETDSKNTEMVHNVLELQLQCASYLHGLKEVKKPY
jgi:hypothetical protein